MVLVQVQYKSKEYCCACNSGYVFCYWVSVIIGSSYPFEISLCFGNVVNTKIAYAFGILGLIITNTAVIVMTLNELTMCDFCAVSI
jgi:hypothetical protein